MRVASIQRFCMHDGPGIRTTVFMKGCPLRCAWCHNPETQSAKDQLLYYEKKCVGCFLCVSCPRGAQGIDSSTGRHRFFRELCNECGACAELCPTGALELCGRDYGVDELYALVERDRPFYGTLGGVTLSGGEPLLQPREAEELLKSCREGGISTAIESCGAVPWDSVEAVIPFTDLFLWDVKDTDPERHRRFTGVTNEGILENLRRADAAGAKTRLRCILVGGINTQMEHYERICRLFDELKGCEGIELIPCHVYGSSKAEALGKNCGVSDGMIPSAEQLTKAREFVSLRAPLFT